MRSVNQSLGRVIRHINDYGVLVLADTRFGHKWKNNYYKDLPAWIKQNIKIQDTFKSFENGLDDFLKLHPST